jgi:hypothetical protein
MVAAAAAASPYAEVMLTYITGTELQTVRMRQAHIAASQQSSGETLVCSDLSWLLLPAWLRGVHAGYIYGGLVGAAMGWRAAFLLEGLMMMPFVAFAFISKPLHLTGSRDHGPGTPLASAATVPLVVFLCVNALSRNVGALSWWGHSYCSLRSYCDIC